MTQKPNLFTDDVSRFTNGWLQKQGFRQTDLDGARPESLSGGLLGNSQCSAGGPKDGAVDLSESFAVVTGGNNFGKFVEAVRGSRLNPFTKIDAGYDLSWLHVNEGQNYQVDPQKTIEWMTKLLGGDGQEGGLAARWKLATSDFQGVYDQASKTWSWKATPAVSQFADWALHSTEFGLLPLENQLTVVDRFVAQVTFPDTTKPEDAQKMRDVLRKELRTAVMSANLRFTANQKISLYTTLRAQDLQAQGESKKAQDLCELALEVDPQNATAKKDLGLLLMKDPKQSATGGVLLKEAYDAGLRDPDLLAGLAIGEAQQGDAQRALALAKEWTSAGFSSRDEIMAFLPQVVDWAKKAGDPLAAEDVYLRVSRGFDDDQRKQTEEALYGNLGWWVEAAEHQMGRYGNYVLARKILDREEILDRGIQEKNIPDYIYRDRAKLDQTEKAINENVSARTQKIRERLTTWEGYMEPRVLQSLDQVGAKLESSAGGEKQQLLRDVGRLERTVGYIQDLDNLTAPPVDASALLAPLRQKVRSEKVTQDQALQMLDAFEKDLAALHPAPRLAVAQKIEDAREQLAAGARPGKVFTDLDKGLDDVLKTPKIRHADVAPLLRDAKSKILGGYLHGNQALYDEGVEDLKSLQRYAAVEASKGNAFTSLLNQYFENSYYIFRKPGDLSGASKWTELDVMFGDYGAKDDAEVKLPVNIRLDQIRRDDPVRGAGYDAQLEDLRRTSRWKGQTGDPIKVAMFEPDFGDLDASGPNGIVDFQEGSFASIDDLNRRSAELEALYDNPKSSIPDLLGEVEQTRATQAVQDNPSYQDHADLETSLQTLPEYVTYFQSFKVFEAKGLEGLTPGIQASGRDFLVARGHVYQDYLKKEKGRLEKELRDTIAADEASSAYYDGDATDFQVSPEVNNLQLEIQKVDTLSASVDGTLSQLEGMDPNDQNAKADNLALLKGAAGTFFSLEQDYARRHLQSEKSDIEAMHADDSNPKSVMPNSDVLNANSIDLNAASMADIQKTVAAYRDYGSALNDVAFSRSLDMKIEMIRDMEHEYKTGKNIENLGLLHVDVNDFEHFRKEYETLRTRWIAGDATVRREFIALENAKINDVLKSKVDSVQYAKFEAGIVIVMASAFTGGLAAEAAAPFLVSALGADLGAAAGYFVNALVFTTSDRFFQSAWSGDWTSFKNIWNHPLGFAEEVIFNAGMFAFLGKATKTYEAIFASRLGRGLVFKAGQFVWSGGAFQVWSFFQQNTSAILHGRFDASKAFEAFGPSAFKDGYVYLFALEMGGVASMPLTESATESFRGWIRKMAPTYAERQLSLQVDQSLKALNDYATTGKGDLDGLLAQHESILLQQRKFLEDLPEGVRNEATYKMNGQALADLRAYREAYQKSVFRVVGLKDGQNPYGLREVTNDGVLTYASAKGVALIQALKADPSVQWVRVSKNGLVTVRVTDPFGRDATIRLDADVRNDQIQKMQEAAKAPSPSDDVNDQKQNEEQPPLVSVLQAVNAQ